MRCLYDVGDEFGLKGAIDFDLNVAKIGIAIYCCASFLCGIGIKTSRRLKWTTSVDKSGLPNARTNRRTCVPLILQVLELVNRLAEQGLAVVLISHNLHDIFETAGRITVLRLGRNVGVYERSKTTQQEIVAAITAGQPTKVAGISSSASAPA